MRDFIRKLLKNFNNRTVQICMAGLMAAAIIATVFAFCVPTDSKIGDNMNSKISSSNSKTRLTAKASIKNSADKSAGTKSASGTSETSNSSNNNADRIGKKIPDGKYVNENFGIELDLPKSATLEVEDEEQVGFYIEEWDTLLQFTHIARLNDEIIYSLSDFVRNATSLLQEKDAQNYKFKQAWQVAPVNYGDVSLVVAENVTHDNKRQVIIIREAKDGGVMLFSSLTGEKNKNPDLNNSLQTLVGKAKLSERKYGAKIYEVKNYRLQFFLNNGWKVYDKNAKKDENLIYQPIFSKNEFLQLIYKDEIARIDVSRHENIDNIEEYLKVFKDIIATNDKGMYKDVQVSETDKFNLSGREFYAYDINFKLGKDKMATRVVMFKLGDVTYELSCICPQNLFYLANSQIELVMLSLTEK